MRDSRYLEPVQLAAGEGETAEQVVATRRKPFLRRGAKFRSAVFDRRIERVPELFLKMEKKIKTFAQRDEAIAPKMRFRKPGG